MANAASSAKFIAKFGQNGGPQEIGKKNFWGFSGLVMKDIDILPSQTN
jgi:hypothetical protein